MLYKLTMLTLPYLKIFTVFSSFPLIIGDDSQNRITSVGIDHSVADGEQYIKRIIHGEKVSENPGLLMFTAPYKLCEGGCKERDGGNIAMGFPLFVGKKGIESYRSIYSKDFEKIHRKNPNAPFKRSTTRPPTTTTPSTTTTTTASTTTVTTTCKIVTIIIMQTTEPPPPTTTVCPFIPFGLCMKYKKNKKRITSTDFTSATVTTPEVTIPDVTPVKNQEVEDNLEMLPVAVTTDDETNITSNSGAPVFKQTSEDINNDYFYNELNITTEMGEITVTEETTNAINDSAIIEDVTETANNDININEPLLANNVTAIKQHNGSSIYRMPGIIVRNYSDYSHNLASSTTENPVTNSEIPKSDLFAFNDVDLDVAVLRQLNHHRTSLDVSDYTNSDNDIFYLRDYQLPYVGNS